MSNTTPANPLFKGATYDKLKFVFMILLPALGTLYFSIAQIWGLGYAAEVSGTILAIDTFGGLLLGLSSAQFKVINSVPDGYLTPTGVDELTGHPDLRMTITRDPHDIVAKKTAVFNITPPDIKP